MVFGFGTPNAAQHLQEIGAVELAAQLRSGSVLVIDVREADEFAAGHIPGAINRPLSDFRPADLPIEPGKTLVLNCLGGKRSGMALERCREAQAAADTHLAGGFGAWTAAGLPVER